MSISDIWAHTRVVSLFIRSFARLPSNFRFSGYKNNMKKRILFDWKIGSIKYNWYRQLLSFHTSIIFYRTFSSSRSSFSLQRHWRRRHFHFYILLYLVFRRLCWPRFDYRKPEENQTNFASMKFVFRTKWNDQSAIGFCNLFRWWFCTRRKELNALKWNSIFTWSNEIVDNFLCAYERTLVCSQASEIFLFHFDVFFRFCFFCSMSTQAIISFSFEMETSESS